MSYLSGRLVSASRELSDALDTHGTYPDNPSVSHPSPSTPVARLHQARRLTRAIATGHYENFTVVSHFLPRRLHQDFYNIYAYCRHADDLADEISDISESRAALARLRLGVEAIYRGEIKDHQPILLALSDTIGRFDIPKDPFLDLIDAFEQDRRTNRYDTHAQVLDYCRRSANPVGRLVLYICGYRDPHRQALSDHICTALQLTNFWQDVRRDYDDRNRIYLPREDMDRFGVTDADIADKRFTPAYRDLLQFQVDRAQKLFDQGEALFPLLAPRYRTDITLFSLGGQAILKRIRDLDYNTVTIRPSLTKWDKALLMFRTITGKLT